MAYSSQLVVKESPRSFKQVIKRTIYYFLPLKRVNFICLGLMMHLLSMLTAASSSKVNHFNSKKKKKICIIHLLYFLTKNICFFVEKSLYKFAEMQTKQNSEARMYFF